MGWGIPAEGEGRGAVQAGVGGVGDGVGWDFPAGAIPCTGGGLALPCPRMLISPARSAIRLRGVRHNNLKNFDLELPLNRLIVLTGLSGSGKSSLAFDTLFAEGQRRYIETFSPYARQFLDRMDKPQVDSIEGIPPAVAIEQQNAVKSTRSTVGTMTEICDFMKVLWPHISVLHCQGCGKVVGKDPAQKVWQAAQEAHGGGEVLITFDVPRSDRLSLEESFQLIRKQGYQRLVWGGRVKRIEDIGQEAGPLPAVLTVIQDRLRIAPANRSRFVEACEQAYHLGKGRLALRAAGAGDQPGEPRRFSQRLHCAGCDIEYAEPSPALFSFNHPVGACPECKGFGRIISIDYDLAVPDRTRTLAQGVVKPWLTGKGAECQTDLMRVCRQMEIPTDVPFDRLPERYQKLVIEGEPGYGKDDEHEWPRAWYGVKGYFRWLESKAYKMHVRVMLSRYRAYTPCSRCGATRFQPQSLLYRARVPEGLEIPFLKTRRDLPDAFVHSLTLADFYELPVRDASRFIASIPGIAAPGGDPVRLTLDEVRSRLGYLEDVGLGYLTLNRSTRSLSGGETERVNLTTCLGTRLVNTLFVLDEPSVGLHPRDTDRLVRILQRLRDAGNTVVVVEHEASIMRAADHIVDLGPGHGATGGELIFQGSYPELLGCKTSLTGQYLAGLKTMTTAGSRGSTEGRRGVRLPEGVAGGSTVRGGEMQLREAIPAYGKKAASLPVLQLGGISLHNLHEFEVTIPLGRLVCVTGVSGSGKSTLIREGLFPLLAARLGAAEAAAEASGEGDESSTEAPVPQGESRPACGTLKGAEHLDRVVFVDQSILGKTPRSNPAVYTGAFDHIRELFARSELAGQRGLNASAFSFNSGQGQCERCRGAGFEKIEMQFLSDVFIRCPDCEGRRYRSHILEIRISPGTIGTGLPDDGTGKSIADMLDATVDEAVEFLAGFGTEKAARQARESLELLREVGLGYLKLGQPINTLSGGESQRLKLVRELAGVGENAPSGGRGGGVARPAGGTLFLFDEPTTGLHFDDVRVLLQVFQRLVDAGNSVLIIEHNLDVIQSADWVIDLGPEAGDLGGRLVAQGTPEELAEMPESHTGRALKGMAVSREGAAASRGGRRPGLALPVVVREEPAPEMIHIHGAREHNLKNITLDVPRNQFVVITGVSGSGKSTLAFDLLFAEGQRRFLDSMNVYARQFVEQLSRPDVDLITGIPPTVSIEQRTSRGGGKSTVATVTEIHHFIRLLFARLGTQYCPDCNLPVEAQTRDELARRLRTETASRGELTLLAPVVRNRKGFHTDVAEWAAAHGYGRVRADGKMHETSERLRLDRFREHDVEIVTGTCAKGASPAALQALVDATLKLGGGLLYALDRKGVVSIHSTERACRECGKSFEVLDPKNFSYNSPRGWCPECRGFGELFYLPDVDRGARAEAIEESWFEWQEGKREPCPKCAGARLNPVARAVRLEGAGPGKRKGGLTMDDLAAMPVGGALEWFGGFKPAGREAVIARDILPEIRERLKFLGEVGLGYLQLGRGVPTLSGGESQRIRLAAQLGSNLSGVLYILDEPTIGLHSRDNEQLLDALQKLKGRGNSIIVVEHDEETMRRADHVIDLGPGAGVHGGQVVAAGTLEELMRHPESITGQSMAATHHHPLRGERRPVKTGNKGKLVLRQARKNNLKGDVIRFPLNRLVLVTGVSGSGKSTLIRECLLPSLESALKNRRKTPESAAGDPLTGWETIQAVYEVNQTPIGRTPRSIPATYVGFFDEIRKLFSGIPEARLRGYSPSRFSFNSKEGRCPTCEGAGVVKLEMNFLPPAFVRCEACGGSRFNTETLDITYSGRNIAEVLELSVEAALEFFASVPRIRRPLQALCDTGLGYIKLGQTSPTLSGGEAQRVKLVSHLLTGLKEVDPLESGTRRNLFILEEPSIGLHLSDVRKLVEVLQRLVDAGHSVIVIEHNLELIAEADWVIDLGPEGGEGGGKLVAEGTPEEVAKCRASHTGRFLPAVLNPGKKG